VAFEDVLLDVEVDGREHHDTRAAFETDRLRQNRLVRAGWTVLRFTPTMIDTDPPGVIEMIRDTLDGLRSRREWVRSRSTAKNHPSVPARAVS
jgi:very-short-patch-repair endonuclease